MSAYHNANRSIALRFTLPYIVSTYGRYTVPRRTIQGQASQPPRNLTAGAPDSSRRPSAWSQPHFILESACVRAEHLIADQTPSALSPQKWREFCELLDRPPLAQPKPRLARLLKEPSVAESHRLPALSQLMQERSLLDSPRCKVEEGRTRKEFMKPPMT